MKAKSQIYSFRNIFQKYFVSRNYFIGRFVKDFIYIIFIIVD